MVDHVLKTWPEPFEAVWQRLKLFEIRKNDRGFKVGDDLCLMEYDPDRNHFTGREILASVTWMLEGPAFGIPEGHVVLSLRLRYGCDHTGTMVWEIAEPDERHGRGGSRRRVL